jgi:hypothetical protein
LTSSEARDSREGKDKRNLLSGGCFPVLGHETWSMHREILSQKNSNMYLEGENPQKHFTVLGTLQQNYSPLLSAGVTLDGEEIPNYNGI